MAAKKAAEEVARLAAELAEKQRIEAEKKIFEAEQRRVEEAENKRIEAEKRAVEPEARENVSQVAPQFVDQSTQSTLRPYDVSSWSYPKLRDAINTETGEFLSLAPTPNLL